MFLQVLDHNGIWYVVPSTNRSSHFWFPYHRPNFGYPDLWRRPTYYRSIDVPWVHIVRQQLSYYSDFLSFCFSLFLVLKFFYAFYLLVLVLNNISHILSPKQATTHVPKEKPNLVALSRRMIIEKDVDDINIFLQTSGPPRVLKYPFYYE